MLPAIVALIGVASSGCGDDGPETGAPPVDDSSEDVIDGSETAGETGDGSQEPSPVATFEVAGGEQYKIELATPELVDHAQRLLDGESLPAIPLGTVVRNAPGVNAPWSWHIDPATLEFAAVTIEVCDGIPSYVEDGIVTSDQFCPWSAKVIAVDGA
jgi:hypothetical protein